MKRSQSYFRTLACSLLIVVHALCAVRARACDTEAKARPDSSCVLMQRAGVRGVWFDLATTQKMRNAVLLADEQQIQLKKYSEMDIVHEKEIQALRDAAVLRAQAVDELQAALAKAAKEARAARDDATQAHEELGAWYRSPVTWFVVGALVGAGATVFVATR